MMRFQNPVSNSFCTLTIFSIVVISAFSFISCDDSIDPKTTYKERYILNFIIRGDTTLQIATLTSSYNVEGVDPSINEIDPAIKDADIKIWYNGEVYTLRDTTIARSDTSRYNNPVHCYYINNFPPAEGKSVIVKAELNNGKKLTAETKLPSNIGIDSCDRIIPLSYKNQFSIVWRKLEEEVYYFVRFRIYYKHNSEFHIVEVPLDYNTINGKVTPVYPGVTRKTIFNYELSALDSVMKNISLGDGQKSSYQIMRGEYEVIIMDKPLSDYYSSIHGYMDDFSIRIDQTDYTNVTGGYGIFASYRKQLLAATLKEEYIRSFGYKAGN
ncbi:MAG: DUF4249 family protein [Ignavibacteriales bacterium]|nr:MAG: DUF4249 family protein [Ignavibacteriales bacterium]